MNERTFSTYLKLTNKILPIAVAFFVVVLLLIFLHKKIICDPRENKILENLEFIEQNDKSITQIILAQSSPGYKINLIEKDFLIENFEVISQIRTKIINRRRGSWDNSMPEWSVLMILYLSNSEEVRIELNHYNNPSGVYTHMYFLFGNCEDDYPNFSKDLGISLEKLVKYNGIKYL